MPDSILTAAERQLLVEHGEQLLKLEQRHGSQRAALAAHPELTETAEALQIARADAGARALGLTLRRGGRPFAPEVLAHLELVFARLVAEDDPQPPIQVTAAARLARLLNDDPVDQGP
jgi:hypothetical protein